MRVAIIGGSGYTGLELLRILKHHPVAEVATVTSRQLAGTSISDYFPSLHGYEGLHFSDPDEESVCRDADIVFTAVPHQAAMGIVPTYLSRGARVIDLSADFRLRDRRVYEAWYQPHSASELLGEAVYGLPEIYGHELPKARLVANPGCYPTSAILPLFPLLKKALLSGDSIVIDSKSGVSGAGRSPSLANIFCEVNEAFKAYKVGNHRHTPEIEQELSRASGRHVVVSFTPHLVPMTRGILTTIYARPARAIATRDVLECLAEAYSGRRFVRIHEEGVFPDVSHVRGSNYCDIGAHVDKRTGMVVMVSALDNLVKGASGQAVQNLNLMEGLDEGTGLYITPLYP